MSRLAFMLAVVVAVGAVCPHCPAADPPVCNPCTPAIDNATVIQAVPGLRASAAIVADYGTCSVLYTGYAWKVSWGDGVVATKNMTYLSPEQAQYVYAAAGTYNVTASYCAYPFYCCESCTSISKVITVV